MSLLSSLLGGGGGGLPGLPSLPGLPGLPFGGGGQQRGYGGGGGLGGTMQMSGPGDTSGMLDYQGLLQMLMNRNNGVGGGGQSYLGGQGLI